MKIERLYSNYQEEEKLYSTGNDELDELMERAFCEGYEYAQKEFGRTGLNAQQAKQFFTKVRNKKGSRAMAEKAIKNGEFSPKLLGTTPTNKNIREFRRYNSPTMTMGAASYPKEAGLDEVGRLHRKISLKDEKYLNELSGKKTNGRTWTGERGKTVYGGGYVTDSPFSPLHT